MGDIRFTHKWKMIAAAIIERDKECAVCGTEENLSVDHITPLSKGGEPYDIDNLQVLCMYHNRQKGSTTIGQVNDWINRRWLTWEGERNSD